MSGEVVMAVRQLDTRFGSHVIHERLDLEVRRGEILGIVGGSGTGKSVLLNTMLGLKSPDGGAIYFEGRDMAAMTEADRDAIETRWGVLFQGAALFSSLTVKENVLAPLREHADMPDSLREEIAEMKIGLVGLSPEAANKFPAELSGGMKKRAGLARSLALDPDVLFLDEPTAGLDPISASQFDELLLELSPTLGLTVVLVTHDLDTLHAVCDRVAVLAERRVVACAPLSEVVADAHPWIREYFSGPRGRAALREA